MPSLKTVSTGVIVRVVVPWLAIFLCVFPVAAQNNYGSHTFMVAAGFLCDPGDSSTCPATAKTRQGDSYEISGAGAFDAQSKSVKGAGTFIHKSPNGDVLGAGVWIASELITFKSYGAAPLALSRTALPFDEEPLNPKRLPISSGPMPTGGLAVFRIHLLPMQGAGMTAVLQVNCALGDVPRERSVEGIRLKLERNNTEYSEELGGRVMFLALRPEVNAPTRTQQQDSPTETSEKPQH